MNWVESNPELKRKNDLQKSKQVNILGRKFPFEYNYYQNFNCIFYKCHDIDESKGFNCHFCHCPYYYKATCPGIESGVAVILSNGCKDCTDCDYNHLHENKDELSNVHLSKEEM